MQQSLLDSKQSRVLGRGRLLEPRRDVAFRVGMHGTFRLDRFLPSARSVALPQKGGFALAYHLSTFALTRSLSPPNMPASTLIYEGTCHFPSKESSVASGAFVLTDGRDPI
jgi:hypothetical protein